VQGEDDLWHWTLTSTTGEVVYSKEGYESPSEAMAAARVLQEQTLLIMSGGADDGGGGSGETDWSKGLLAVAGALVVGVLAALGVSGRAPWSGGNRCVIPGGVR
jgi:hypothetical protein